MDLPRSSLLGRLQAFLPEMEKANRETEKLAEEGKLAVLDDKLEVVDSDGRKDQVEDTDSEDDEEENEGEENEGEEGRGGERAGEAVPPRSVQLVRLAWVSALNQPSRQILTSHSKYLLTSSPK